MTLVLVLGGARSGKSRYAEGLAHRASAAGTAVTYLATAGAPRDAEMAERIATHQARRPAQWSNIEAPRAIEPIVCGNPGFLLVDCLTLWLTNVMLSDDGEDVATAIDGLTKAMTERAGTVVAVSNETGQGIVPATSLGRAFRDAQGVLNQRVATIATHVVLMAAGCPILAKPRPEPEIKL